MKNIEVFLAFLFIVIVLAMIGTTSPDRTPMSTNNSAHPAREAAPKNYDAEFARVLEQQSQAFTAKAINKLKSLVQSHPDASISRDLNSLVVSGTIFVSYQDVASSNAAASVIWVNTKTHGEVLTLQAPASWLMNPNQSDKAKQLIIYHEYQHIQQQLKGAEPRWMAYQVKNGAPMSATQAEQWFEAEYLAYEAEAKLAKSLGWQEEIDICRAYATNGRSGLRKALANAYSTMPEHSKHAELFRKLAER